MQSKRFALVQKPERDGSNYLGKSVSDQFKNCRTSFLFRKRFSGLTLTLQNELSVARSTLQHSSGEVANAGWQWTKAPVFGRVLRVGSHLSPAQEAIQHGRSIAQLVGDIDHIAAEECVAHAHERVCFGFVQIGHIRSIFFGWVWS